MKKILSILLVVAISVAICGCAAKETPPVISEPPADYETVSWDAVSIEPEDYGITREMLEFIEEPPFQKYTLAELCAYYLHTDGAGAEGSGDTLYERFMEAPNTVLNYFALIGDQVARGGASGSETAVTELCQEIASADVAWHGTTEEFDSIIKQYQEIYSSGRIAEILNTLQEEHIAAIERNS